MKNDLKSLSLVLLLVSLSGCLKWKEELTIAKDGSATVALNIKGDAEDLDGGVLKLPGEEAFRIERRVEPKANGKGQDHVLTARADYRRVADMPESFGDENPGAWRFRNRLLVREEQNRTVYVYIREYQARPWAEYQHRYDKALPPKLRKLAQSDWSKQPWAQRRKVIDGLVAYECGKHETWIREALKVVKAPQGSLLEAELASVNALRTFVSKNLSANAVAKVLELPAAELSARIKAIQRGLSSQGLNAAIQVLGLEGAPKSALEKAYNDAKHGFELSEDLSDESFEIDVRMPGDILSSNGRQLTGSKVRFEFHGKDLRDRVHRLVVISALKK